ncbi:MAG: hypothetical protein DRH56_01145 [Deltaproteobacteria bacterium]|nr:MAG: hypothetical protein DRH56_01145 [Deltaproteobacteria bacterium]
MSESTGYIEIDMFPEEINDMEHWEVVHFKGLLEEVAEEYHCRLVAFSIDHGTVTFAFDSDILMAEIVRILQDDRPD